MRRRRLALGLLGLVLWACGQEPAAPEQDAAISDETGGHDGAASDAERDEREVDARDDEAIDGGALSGPVTHVADEIELVVDRLCDLDGDGLLDNGAADLGGTHADLFVASFNAYLGNPRELLTKRALFHLPWVDDRRRPEDDEVTLILPIGMPIEPEGDPEEEFTGDATFDVDVASNDACGEPRALFPASRIEDGALETTVESDWLLPVTWELALVAERARVTGLLAPGASEGEWSICGFVPISTVGGVAALDTAGVDVSLLEMLVGGGDAFGIPGLPGITPDVDLDGDGFERVVLDDAGLVLQCIDGDLTPIDGRDCWQDPRMADAFSLNMRFHTVPGHLLEFDPWYRRDHSLPCESRPERSAWNPS